MPEVWNPLNGAIADAAAWQVREGRTEVELTLAPYESTFVVLRRVGQPEPTAPCAEPTVRPLETAAWNISFDRYDDPAVEVERAQLFDWTTDEDIRIRYFSGTATYRTSFCYAGEATEVVLRLGAVHDVAAVRLNGVACGTAWTAPYEVNLTGALQQGDNTLEIELSNCWANALVGAETGNAPFSGIWTNARYRRKAQTLLPSGLIGPLELVETK